MRGIAFIFHQFKRNAPTKTRGLSNLKPLLKFAYFAITSLQTQSQKIKCVMQQKPLLRPLIGGALLLILAVPALAQPGGRGPRDGRDGPPPDGRGPRDEMRGGPHRGPRAKGELNRVWHDIADLEGSKLALSKAQAAKVVALVLPVSKQKTLSDASAQSLADKVEAVLTPAQRAEIEKDHPRGPHGNRPPGGPMDGPPPRDGEGHGPRDFGPPPRDGEERGPRDFGPPPRDGEGHGPRGDGPPRLNREDFEKVRPFMDALNPFYAPTGYAGFKSLPADFQKDVAKRYGERRTLLETLSKRAKGK